MRVYTVVLYFGSAGDEVHVFTTQLEAIACALTYCKEHCENNDHTIDNLDGEAVCACQMIADGLAGEVLSNWEHDAYGEHGSRWDIGTAELPGVVPLETLVDAEIARARAVSDAAIGRSA